MYCAQYGNRLSTYGNIQYGFYRPFIKSYGGWPEERVILDPVPDPAYEPLQESESSKNIAIIKRLRAELAASEDTMHRQHLRDEIERARFAKIKAFQLQADDEDTAFILFN